MAVFISKSPNQVLTMVPTRREVVDGVVVIKPGQHIRFNNSEYRTTDKKEIDFVKKHSLFNTAITEAEETVK